jgi:hypothetical protein
MAKERGTHSSRLVRHDRWAEAPHTHFNQKAGHAMHEDPARALKTTTEPLPDPRGIFHGEPTL